MKQVLIILIAVLVVAGCETSNVESLKKATLDGQNTLETTFNSIAGPDGSVSWYNPPENPGNKNFKLIGAKVHNKNGAADFVILIDTSDMTAAIQSVSFDGKTIHYDQLGIPDDMDTFSKLTEWTLKGSFGL
jgi:hypothetical protein